MTPARSFAARTATVLAAAALAVLGGHPATAASAAGAPPSPVAPGAAVGAPTAAPAATAPAVTRVPAATGITQLGEWQDQTTYTGTVLEDTRGWMPVAARSTRTLDLFRGSPVTAPDDATAAILTVTVVAPDRAGDLTVYATDLGRPAVSTVNFAPGTPTPNAAVVPLVGSRRISLYNASLGNAHVIVSLRGWVRGKGGERAGSLVTGTPTRVVDTRRTGGLVPAKGYRDVRVTGVGAPTGASAALLNIVAVGPRSAGYLVAHSPDTARPATTTLTYRVGGNRASLSPVPLSSSGTVRLWNMSASPVHLVVDSSGWVVGGSSAGTPAGTVVTAPRRLLDTRTTAGPVVLPYPVAVPLPTRDTPEGQDRPSGVVLTLTATGATRGGHLSIEVPDEYGNPRPGPSVLNFARGETVTTSVWVTAPLLGDLMVRAHTSGSVHVVVDQTASVRSRVLVTGRVVDLDGAPLSPAAVGPRLNLRENTTAPDGTFRLTHNGPTGLMTVCAFKLTSSGSYDNGWSSTCLRQGDYAWVVNAPIGERVEIGDDLRLERVGTLTGRVVGPTPSDAVSGVVRVERLGDTRVWDTDIRGGGSWQVTVPEGRYVVSTLYGMRRGIPGTYLANEVASGLPRIYRQGSPVTERDRLVESGARVFDVTGGTTVSVPVLTFLDAGTVTPVITDPDGDLTDVSIDYVDTDSGYRVWGYPVGSPTGHVQSSVPLRPGHYAVCVTEGPTTVCQDGSSTPRGSTPLEVVSGRTVEVPLTLP